MPGQIVVQAPQSVLIQNVTKLSKNDNLQNVQNVTKLSKNDNLESLLQVANNNPKLNSKEADVFITGSGSRWMN